MAFRPAGKQDGKKPEAGNMVYAAVCICCL